MQARNNGEKKPGSIQPFGISASTNCVVVDHIGFGEYSQQPLLVGHIISPAKLYSQVYQIIQICLRNLNILPLDVGPEIEKEASSPVARELENHRRPLTCRPSMLE
jgi:hypothetical protein